MVVRSYSDDNEAKKTRIKTFFRSLALCHDTIPEIIDGSIRYYGTVFSLNFGLILIVCRLSASNPDDEALVYAAAYFGYEFKDKREKYAIVKNNNLGVEESVEMLDTIGFTSKRKRMSVIVREIDGKIKMIIKGADSAIAPRLAPGQEKIFQLTDDHMRQYSVEGMRCLVVGQKDISEDEYREWHSRYMAALTNLSEVEKRKAGEENLIDMLEDIIEQGECKHLW